jgi:outer membrane protein assembly factor BamB
MRQGTLTQLLRVLVILMASLAAAACGGGGGGSDAGGGDGGGGSTTTPPPAVTLTSLTPAAVNAGTGATVITATGSGFTASSVIEWNGTALTTSYVSATSLTATLPVADLAAPGAVSVTVSNASSGGASSSIVTFTIGEQTAPTVASLAPAAMMVGGDAFQLIVTGTNFQSGATVLWNGSAIPTVFDSATQLTAQVTAAQIAALGTIPVAVANDAVAGGTSNVTNFSITATPPAPTITSLSPASLPVGSAAFQLTVTGTNFAAGATVIWNGTTIPTVFQSSTQLTAQVTTAQIANVASIPVAVANDAFSGGTSNVSNFTVTASAPVPTLTALAPNSVPANNNLVQMTLTGTNFSPQTQVLFGGSLVNSTYVSASQITFSVYGYWPSSGTTDSVAVEDPASGYVSSNALQLTVTPAVPVITNVAPATLTQGQGATTITVTGQYFSATSVIYFNGSARPTTFSNAQLIAQLTATDLSAPGTQTITIEDPVSANTPSGPASLVIQPLPPLALTSLFPSTVPAGNGVFTLTVVGNGFSTNSAIAWNGTALTTSYVSVTTLQASVSANLVASIGTAPITVVNPANQGGTSAPQTLTIVKPSIDAVSYQINNGHTGSITFQSASLPNAASWSVNIGGTPSYAVIVGQTVYVMANNNGNSQLFALNAATGATVWGPIAFSGPAGVTYDGGMLFINSGSYISSGILVALDATTGNQKWSATIPGEFATQSPPVAAQGIVYILEDGTLTAYAESSGAQLWLVSSTGTNGSAAVTVDGVYISQPCMVFDFVPATGAVVWSHNTGCDGGGGETPVVGYGRAYAAIGGLYSGNVYDSEAGTVLGAFNYSVPPAVSATHAYTLFNSTLQGLTLSNNQIDWSFAGDGMLVTSPIVVNNYVFVGSTSGNLYGLDATTGALLWTQSMGAAIPGPENGGYALQGYSGLSAGDGLLIVPAGNTVTAYVLSTNP